MSLNAFKPRKFEDHEIVDEKGKKVGEIRVKPSGILWAPKGAQKWYGVDLKSFAAYMTKEGKLQKM